MASYIFQRLHLKGHRVLESVGINEIEYNPTSPFQIIMGSNGSGKSTLFSELHVLPADHNYYTLGGFKTIELRYNDKQYRLHSEKVSEKSMHHYFYVDGEDINGGGTAAAQKTLVLEHFGLTPDLISIINGSMLFSRMDTATRRRVITQLVGTNLDKALSVFNKLKTKHRDSVGTHKYLRNRIAEEENSLLTEDQVKRIRDAESMLHNDLTILINNKVAKTNPSSQVWVDLQNLMRIVEVDGATLQKVSIAVPECLSSYKFTSLGQIATALEDFKQQRVSNQELLRHCQAEFETWRETIETIQSKGLENASREMVESRLSDLKYLHGELVDGVEVYHYQTDSATAIQQAHQLHATLLELITALPDNSDKRLQRQKYDQLMVSNVENDLRLKQAEAKFAMAVEKIDHIEKAATVDCPQCGYYWQPGVGVGEIVKIREHRNKLEAHITELKTKLETDRRYVAECGSYLETLRTISVTFQAYPLMKPLWETLVKKSILTTRPYNTISELKVWTSHLEKFAEMDRVTIEIGEQEKILGIMKTLDDYGSSDFINNVQELSDKISALTEKDIVLDKRLQEVTKYYRLMDAYHKQLDRLVNAHDTLTNLVNNYQEALRQESIDGQIRLLQGELAVIRQELVGAEVAQGMVDDLKRELVKNELEKEAWQILTDEMSPTSGLIADQLKLSITGLTLQWNNHFKQIWEYDMEIQPCGLESDELDYKFPVIIRNFHPAVKDVSQMSGGQVDLVDFAFRLVTMQYCGHPDHPLLLDELAPTFDEKHRANLVMYLQNLVESHTNNQMFMISHYYTSHGSFNSAETCIMDPKNLINLPAVYNGHVTIH